MVACDCALRGECDATGVDVPPEEHLREVDKQEDTAVDLCVHGVSQSVNVHAGCGVRIGRTS